MKLIDNVGIKRFVSKILEVIGNKVAGGEWLPIRKGVDSNGNVVQGAVAEGKSTRAEGVSSHAEGYNTTASGTYSHAEGYMTTASGGTSHAQGYNNYDNPSFIDMVGVGSNYTTKNASVIYVGRDSKGRVDPSDPKNGYQYLLGVGGYQGQAIGTDTKSIQEVIEDFESRISLLENSLS